jgi:ribonuclease T2
VLSCSKDAVPDKVDSCCSETFGGLVLSTQFWSTYTGLEDQGQLLPEDSWTLHGLWPDFCNGSYTQYCDLDRQYDPAPSPTIAANGKSLFTVYLQLSVLSSLTRSVSTGSVITPWTGPPVNTFIESFGRYDLLEWMDT